MKRRLYRDDGTTDPEIDLKHMGQQVHALFCQWVKSNYHEHDFLEALEHRATALYTGYRIEGSPEIPEHLLLPDSETLLSLVPFFEEPMTEAELKPRFYTAHGNLNGDIGLDEEFEMALAQLFAHWVFQGNHARDFIQAVKDRGAGVLQSYTTSSTMGGLGGCKTAHEFLNSRPAAIAL